MAGKCPAVYLGRGQGGILLLSCDNTIHDSNFLIAVSYTHLTLPTKRIV